MEKALLEEPAVTLQDDEVAGEQTEKAEVGADDTTCAICLDQIKAEELAVVKGCDHFYCVTCILNWAVHKESTVCPQCKAPFTHLYTHRALDGTLYDYPMEESVCLLKRARWFEDYLKALEKGACESSAVPPAFAAGVSVGVDWQDELVAQFEDEYEDDEVEDFYFSSAAGRARVTIGNRRWGENGYVAAGRMQARPAPPARPAAKGGKGKGKNRVASSDALAPGPSTPDNRSRSAAPETPTRTPVRGTPDLAKAHASKKGKSRGSSSTPLGREQFLATPTSGGDGNDTAGRRARRNARREAADARGAGSLLASP